jgi:hypothetical protein
MYLLVNRLEDAAHNCGLAFQRANLVPSDLIAPRIIVRVDIQTNEITYTIQNHDLYALFTIT